MEKLENQALTRFERLWKIEGDKLLRLISSLLQLKMEKSIP